MIIKQPAVYDTSHWETIPDFAQVEPRPLLVITKATEGTGYTDPTFAKYMSDLKQDGIQRGCFHFHRKAYNSGDQARHFCNTVRAHVDNETILALDVEEGGETASQLQAWLAEVERQFPDNLIMVYSRKNILDPITMTAAQKVFFRRFPIWTAGYPANPDLYTAVPDFYVPDKTRYGPVWLWQYSDKGSVKGIQEAVDLNWISPVLAAILGDAPPTGDVMTEPLAGVRSISGVRYGWQFVIDLLDPAKVRMEISHARTTDKRETVSAVARAKNATLAYNGGEWDRGISPAYPLDYSVSNGVVYQPDSGLARPSLILSQTAMPKIAHEGKGGAWQAVTGARYIVQGGASPSYLDGTAPQYTEGHNRTCYGVTLDGRVMVLTCDGAYPNQGLTLKQASVLMRQYGAVAAFDGGGGGDTTRVLNGIVTNNPQDGAERRVPEFFLAYADGGDMANGKAKEVLGKTGTIRTSPEAVTGNDTGKRVAAFSTIEFVKVVDGKSIPADKWFLLPDGNYLNYILNGRYYYQITLEPIPDVPPADGVADMPYTITLGGGTSPYVETVVSGVIKAK